jgi:branched-chain amino acid transport system ATP-binding protein
VSDAVLDVQDLTMDFGGLRAVDHVNLHVKKGEIAALIGPNGAGKTTFFNCVTGVYKPTKGKVGINPEGNHTKAINGTAPHRVTQLGLARTFQNIRLFNKMTVLENVMIGRHCRLKEGVLGALFRLPVTKAEEEKCIDDSYTILKKIGLEKWANEHAMNLPYGEQRRLEIARALATDPFLLLLDEPAAGMNPQETQDLIDLINRLRDSEDISVLLIEHDMSLVMKLSERIYVMDYGKRIAEGTPAEISKNPVVRKAYLGEDFDA